MDKQTSIETLVRIANELDDENLVEAADDLTDAIDLLVQSEDENSSTAE